MLTRFLLVTTIAYFSRPTRASPNDNLVRVLESTTRFFDQLKLDYESLPRSPELYKLIDDRIDEYVNKIKKSTNLSRAKRQLNRDKDIRILSGFERVAGLDLSNVIDVTFFVYRGADAARWYAAALNSSGISLYRYHSRNFSHVGFFEVENGERVISQSNDVATLLVVQRRLHGDVLVVRLSLDDDSSKFLPGVQRIDAPEVAHTAIWQGMKKIYLAVSTPREIGVYVWLGKHFDGVQTLSIIGVTKIVAFRASGVVHLMTIEPRRAAILKFLPHTRKFVIVQGLAGGADGISFDLEKGHNGEYFVAVARRNSSVVYKQTKHRFVPFQAIAGADSITAFHDRAAILLFLVRNTGSLRILQYDGWRFVESGIREASVVLYARTVNLGDETFLAYSRKGSRDVAARVEGVVDGTNATKRPYWEVEGSSLGNVTTWSFRKIVWGRKETWSSLRERTKLWCRDTLKNVSPVSIVLPILEVPLIIERAHVETLRTRKVNDRSAEKFAELRKRLDAIVSETKREKTASKRYVSTVNPVLKNLRARDVHVNCTTTCRAENTITEAKEDFLERIRWIDEPEQNFNFVNVRTSYASNLPCPYPAPKFQHVTANGLVNGVDFSTFFNDLVKVTGDQVFTGSPVFRELRVQNANIPLDIASDFTRQEIVAMNTLRVDDLNVTSGHFLLPLTNDSSSVMSGSLAIRKVRIWGLLDSRGKIDGPGSALLSPVVEVNEEHLEITGNFSLGKAKIVRLLRINDLEGPSGKSYNEIISRAIPVDSEHVPVRLRFRNDSVSWSNVTSSNLPYKWLTKKHSSHVVVTGHKNATQPVITLGDKARENLPIPRLPLRLCSSTAISKGIWESNLVIDRGFAKSVRATNLFSGSELSRVYADAASSLDEVPWGLKNLTGRIVVGDASIGQLEGVDYQRLKKSFGRWRAPGRLKGPVRFANLKLDQLVTSNFYVPLPNEVRSLETKANLHVGMLNRINVEEFMKNAVKLDDTLSLTDIEFAGGLVAEEILASKTSFGLQENMTSGYLGSKEITGALECDKIEVANFPIFPPSDSPINIITNGNVRFTREPKIVNLNSENLNALYEEVWLTNEPSKITADFVELRNVTFESDLTILGSIDTPNLGPWTELEKRLLSKTRSQRINVKAAFERIVAPALVAAPKSRLRTNVTYIHDLEYNSLKNDDQQAVTNSWNFDELIVTGNFDLRGRINGLNLSSDVVRRDVERNTVTGKKIFRELKALNVDGLRFEKFARRALRSSSANKNEKANDVVKGWKIFKSVEMGDLRVDGTLMDRRIEDSLLKSTDQKLRGTKVFRGFVATPSIVNEAGLVNGIKLRSFVEQQLKKRDGSAQFIRTPIMMCNNVTILGNVTIEGLYNGVELKNMGNVNDKTLRPMAVRSTELLNHAEGIELALESRAVYWDKLELLEENAKPLISENPATEEIHVDDALGDCGIVDLTLHCNGQRFWQILPSRSAYSNGSRVVQARLIDDSGRPLLVYVTADPGGGVFVYRYDPVGKNFYEEAGLRVPGIVEGSLTTTTSPLWISLRLGEHLMLLRYETWVASFEQWILPGGEDFLMSSTPTDELLILRYDGVWKLGGLGGPRHIFQGALLGQIDTFTHGRDYYVQLTDKNTTTLLKTRYIGD